MKKAENLEEQALSLLREARSELSAALKGWSEGTYELREHYLFHTARLIDQVTEGYIHLRRSGRVDASRHLVRNVIEAAIRLLAVQKKPELLFRIAFREYGERKRWAKCTKQRGTAIIAVIENEWATFKRAYASKHPSHVKESGVDLRALAEAIKLEDYYDTYYRLYCQITHAAFAASAGDLKWSEKEDNFTMVLCTLGTLEVAWSVGALEARPSSLLLRYNKLRDST